MSAAKRAALPSEIDNKETGERVRAAFEVSDHAHEHDGSSDVFAEHYEHGHWWIICDCGAQWSVVDQVGGDAIDGFGFEQVSDGDEA